MFLSDGTIRKYIDEGIIEVTPFEPKYLDTMDSVPGFLSNYGHKISAGSLDIRLSDYLTKPKTRGKTSLTFGEKLEYHEYEGLEELVVKPNSYIISRSVERVKLPDDIDILVLPRSSVFRAGISLDGTWGDAGYEGTLSLKLFNQNDVPFVFRPGDRVAQIVFCQQDRPSENPYGSRKDDKYMNQGDSVGSKAHLDNE